MANLDEEAVQTELCRYGVMSFFKNDNTISRSLGKYGEWAQGEIDFLESLISTGDTVLDIGAFIGTHTLAFAHRTGSRGTVYAFEPHPIYFGVLKKNVEQNALTNVRLLNLAVSDNVGHLELPELNAEHSGNFGGAVVFKTSPAASNLASCCTIDVTTVDQLGINTCNLIKIDAENMEINVLRGARKTLCATRPVVFAECNSLEHGWPVVEFSREEGYCAYLLNVRAFNAGNFRHSRNNFFGDLREAGLILIPSEQFAAIQERLREGNRFSQLIPISCIDDLALALLKKPQYKYEVMATAKAAAVLGNEFWANEIEVMQFRERIQFGEVSLALSAQELARRNRELAQSAEKIAALETERQELRGELVALRQEHEQTVRTLASLRDIIARLRNAAKIVLSPRRWIEDIRLLRDMRLVGASELFDTDWYLQQNPDVPKAGVNPLAHYLRRGAAEGRDPNPLFDSDWYLRQNPDVVKAGVNPLSHYLQQGASEGRNPSLYFSSNRYWQRNPDVAKAGVNPLVHYLHHGIIEGRDSGVQWHSRPVLNPELIVCPRSPSGLQRSKTDRCLICVTHVLPYPLRAGTGYRLHRMLTWLAGQGFEIFLVICPLPGDSTTPQRLMDACSVYPNLILCQREGTLLYRLADSDAPVKGLTGVEPRDFGKLLGEDNDATVASRVLPVVHAFCPDPLVEVLLHLDSVLQPEVFLLDYVFMTRAFPLLRPDALKVVDTHDVFSTKGDKVIQFGNENRLALTPEEEAELLDRADLIIAIQPDEAEELRQLAPKKQVLIAGADFGPVDSVQGPVHDAVILLVGSDNSLNVKGLRDFLRFAWPLIRRDVPGAELRVVGAVGRRVEIEDPAVKIMGLVDDLAAAYAEARVVINPAIAGRGLKIKTIEALCHLRPVVTWPSGVDGIDDEMRALCHLATSWYGFAQHVIHLCASTSAAEALLDKRDEIREKFSPDTIYRELGAAMSKVQAGLK